MKVGGEILYHQGLAYLFVFVKRFWIPVLLIPLVFLGKAIRLNAKLKTVIPYFASMILMFSFYIVYVGGDFMDMFRFLVPILPFFFFLVQEGFRGMYQYSRLLWRRKQKVAWITSMIPLIGLSLFLLAFPSKESNQIWSRGGIDSIGLLRDYARAWSKVGLMFKSIAKPGESLSTCAAGAIPYYSELYAIDELGLTFASQSQSDFIMRQLSKPGHRKIVTDEFLISRKLTYVLGQPKVYDEYSRPNLKWVGGELFHNAGYKFLAFPIKISENETKYLYCLSLRKFNYEKIQD